MGGADVEVYRTPKICQLCVQQGHKAPSCPYLNRRCKEPGCNGIMEIIKGGDDEGNVDVMLLKCEYDDCKGAEYLYKDNKPMVPEESKAPFVIEEAAAAHLVEAVAAHFGELVAAHLGELAAIVVELAAAHLLEHAAVVVELAAAHLPVAAHLEELLLVVAGNCLVVHLKLCFS
ncbi:hypothetical protein IFM89_013931 [Coptis chinensis]|uniref:Uncharacterized protein n=1 Tax=Coptis chinensis TaxID=261450 RepID=A0A835HEX9_9MAGN|nr:hypothetical protein IFM89_013931 [Coptis chinensis]